MTGAGSGQGAGMAVAGTVLAVRSRWMGQAAPEADGAARDPGRGGGWDEPHRARRRAARRGWTPPARWRWRAIWSGWRATRTMPG